MTDYFRDVWPRVVARRYDEQGGHMLALVEMDIEVLGELVHVTPGRVLTRDEALCYHSDVQHVFRKGETGGSGTYEPDTQQQAIS